MYEAHCHFLETTVKITCLTGALMNHTEKQIPECIQFVVTDLLGLVRSFADGDYGIALGGSYAKGIADEVSDLDIYLFAPVISPCEKRETIASAFSPDITSLVCWDVGNPIMQGGVDFRFHGRLIETWLRSTTLIDDVIEECRQGIVKRDMVTWTTTGFYNHCCLSDINVMISLDDPAGIISRWKSEITVYPPKLQNTIIEQHLAAARFWPWNPHYQSAVDRGDIIYITGIVQQVVHNILQVLFALNETYFPGDKKLLQILDHLHTQPPQLGSRVNALLWSDTPASPQALIKQQNELRNLVDETTALVKEMHSAS
jgi:hypothetical protein